MFIVLLYTAYQGHRHLLEPLGARQRRRRLQEATFGPPITLSAAIVVQVGGFLNTTTSGGATAGRKLLDAPSLTLLGECVVPYPQASPLCHAPCKSSTLASVALLTLLTPISFPLVSMLLAKRSTLASFALLTWQPPVAQGEEGCAHRRCRGDLPL